MKLIKKILFNGEIKLLTGTLIGGTDTGLTIGGIDKVIIRHPLTNQPYIPGSSIKGKMRSLYELSKGEIGGPVGGPVQNGPSPNSSSARLFGNATGGNNQRPSRLIVRDAFLINDKELLEKTEFPYVEVKTEVVIDRITSAAMPRTFERVPAKARFGLQMVLNIFENDQASQDELLQSLASSLRLLQDDYIGGSGSRGYGQIDITLHSIKIRTSEGYYLNSEAPIEAEADDNIQKLFESFLKKKN